MIIQALGGCCKKSQTNYENAVKAAAAAGLFTTVEHVTDMEQIMNLGVLATPGIAIDGKVMASGRVSTVAQILEMIEKRRPVAAAARQGCCEDEKCECECDAANPEKQKDCCHDQSETCCGR
ncbi:MAG TPA: hypothetical protein DCR44_05740 [Acholeplasmatales bacterium]|nr:MAG: hypothetical protein A2Y16_03080 [Tenericutes bacterium GWF2_57_13]HAQ56881.1 hypothetical protein [Acholeplasmatales bacterium]